MNFNYSDSFQELISPPDKLEDLLLSCSFSGTFQAWEQRKAFIAEAIHKDGAFLDIGCGNGFLLRCLQEWSEFEITPYGIDINEDYVKKTWELFPERKNNFAVLDSRDIESISVSLPKQYDFVFYSSNWSNRNPNTQDVERIENLRSRVAPGGRLIIGFYGQEANSNQEAVRKLEELGVGFSKVFENPHDTNLIAWIDVAN